MSHTDVVHTACNNTFQPTKFALDYSIKSTVTAPTSGGNAVAIYPGDSFDVEFEATANISASFLNGAYGLIGPQAITILGNQVTIAPLHGATGAPVVISDSTTIPLPQPGDVRALTFTSGSTHVTGVPQFTNADVGANLYKSGAQSIPGGTTIASVNGDGSAELSANATATNTASYRVWQFLSGDLPLLIGTQTGSFTAASLSAPFQASFQILGNSTTTGDPVLGNGNSGLGFTSSSSIDPSAMQTAVTASLGPGIEPALVCMGGQWTETVDPGPPPSTTYDLPYTAPSTATGAGGFAVVDISPLPIPTATVSGVTGLAGAPAQFVTTAARAGNTLHFGGGNWTPNAVVDSVQLCDSAGTNCDAAGLSGVTASINGSGVLTGSADVDSSATTGAGRTLKVTAGSEEDHRAVLLILGAPTLTLGAGSGPAGGTVSFTGTNWNPLAGGVSGSVFAAPVDVTTVPPTLLAAPTPVVINATGGLSGSVVTPAGTGAVSVFDGNPAYPQPPGPGTPGSLFGFGLFSINQNAQSCGSDSPLVGCTLDQSLYLNVEPGDFTWSQDTPFIVLNAAGRTCAEPNQTTCYGMTLDGTTQTVTGNINEITIIDARGAGAPWDVSATMTDLVTGAAGANEVLPASSMTLTPACAVVDGAASGGSAAVTAGAAGALSNSTPLGLCSAAAGEAGGTFTVNGALTMDVPPSIYAGLYTGTITFTAV